MSIDYLEDLEVSINGGREFFACPGVQAGEWHLSQEIADLRRRAMRTANVRKFPISIYRLVNIMDTVADDSYLVVRKILDPGARGEPRFQWGLVDTRQAAEMLRDVSQGPSPYFGAVVEETVEPTVKDES